MSSSADYKTLTSIDGFSFVVESKLIPGNFGQNLPYESKIVETLIQYLHFRYLNMGKQPKSLPKFDIEPELALEVLKAAIDLNI